MTIPAPAGAAGAPELVAELAPQPVKLIAVPEPLAKPQPVRRHRRRTNRATMRRRREAAARSHRAVMAALELGEPNPVLQSAPVGLFVRKDVLEPAGVRALLASCSPASRLGIRDRAMIAAGYWACVRLEEAAALQLDDVDQQGCALTVRGHNGTRVLELPPEASELLAAWADKRRRLHKPRMHVGLFCTLREGQRPGPMTRQMFVEALERVARAAKIAEPVSFEALRCARARELALAGAELGALCDLLDHMHLKTPRRDGGGRGELRQDLERTRRLVTELAPHAPCVGFYRRGPKSPVTDPSYRLGKEPPNKGNRYPAEVLTPDELRAMLRALPKRGSISIRNRALIVVLWRCGLRVAEALDLEPKDIDLKLGTVTVLHGKGNKRRTVGIDRQACRDVERWLAERETLGLDPRHGKVFCVVTMPYRGRPMRQASFRDALKRLARKAGIRKRVHPHGLRHTHAFELMQEGVPLPIIQKQLGHNDLATTAKYVDHLNPRQLIEIMQARQWAFTR